MHVETRVLLQHQLEGSAKIQDPSALPPGKLPIVPTLSEVELSPEQVRTTLRRGNA
jgi:hypothetical protein